MLYLTVCLWYFCLFGQSDMLWTQQISHFSNMLKVLLRTILSRFSSGCSVAEWPLCQLVGCDGTSCDRFQFNRIFNKAELRQKWLWWPSIVALLVQGYLSYTRESHPPLWDYMLRDDEGSSLLCGPSFSFDWCSFRISCSDECFNTTVKPETFLSAFQQFFPCPAAVSKVLLVFVEGGGWDSLSQHRQAWAVWGADWLWPC